MNKTVGFGICFQHSARFLFNAVQTDLVSYPRPGTAKVVTVQMTPCRIFIAREDSGCSGAGQESKSSASSLYGRGQGPHFQSLGVTSPVQSLQTQQQPCVSLPGLQKEQDQRRESSLPKFFQVLFLVVYQVFQPLPESIFFFLIGKKILTKS